MIQFPEKYYKIWQHNAITSSRHSFTKTEKQIIYSVIDALNKIKDWDKKDLAISIDYRKLMEIENQNYTQFKSSCRKLVGRVFEVSRPDGWECFALISRAFVSSRDTMAHFQIPANAVPFFAELKPVYEKTGFYLSHALTLKSIYSQRLYEMCSQFSDTGWMILDVEELRDRLKLNEEGSRKYDRYTDFTKKVLLPAKSELYEKTDIGFDFEPYNKRGKKILSLKFNIYKGKKHDYKKSCINHNINYEKHFEKLKKTGMSSVMIKKYLKVATEPALEEFYAAHRKAKMTDSIKGNEAGWCATVLNSYVPLHNQNL